MEVVLQTELCSADVLCGKRFSRGYEVLSLYVFRPSKNEIICMAVLHVYLFAMKVVTLVLFT